MSHEDIWEKSVQQVQRPYGKRVCGLSGKEASVALVISERAVGSKAREHMQRQITQGLLSHCRDFGFWLHLFIHNLYLVVQDDCSRSWHSTQWQEEKGNSWA